MRRTTMEAIDLIITPGVHEAVITPQVAEDLLAANNRNRPVSKGVVQRYAREMRGQRWVMNGEAIKVGKDGNLLDGQHRLHACIVAGTPFSTLVVTGLDEEVFTTLDRGKKRSIADNLALLGEKNVTKLGGALTLQWKYDNDILEKTGLLMTPEVDEALDTLGRHPGLRDAVRAASRIAHLASPSTLAFLYYQFALRDEEIAVWLYERLADGAGIEDDEPVYRLRERLLRNRMETKAKLPGKDVMALIIKAWNLTVEGRRVRSLVWRATGPAREDFPQIKP
jgi:hypothetical protein